MTYPGSTYFKKLPQDGSKSDIIEFNLVENSVSNTETDYLAIQVHVFYLGNFTLYMLFLSGFELLQSFNRCIVS